MSVGLRRGRKTMGDFFSFFCVTFQNSLLGALEAQTNPPCSFMPNNYAAHTVTSHLVGEPRSVAMAASVLAWILLLNIDAIRRSHSNANEKISAHSSFMHDTDDKDTV